MASAHPVPLGRAVSSSIVGKPGGGKRRLTMLGPAEAAAYARVVARVAPAVERRLGPEVFANRAPGGIDLEPWRRARRRWRTAALRLAGSGSLVAMDVEDFYASVTPEAVGAALSASGVPPAAGRDVVALLRVFADAGVTGVPIGPDPSAILANAVLASLDEELRSGQIRFVRWVDDLLIRDERSRAGTGELAVEAALRTVGLRANHAKHRRGLGREEARLLILGSGGVRLGY